MSWKYNPFTGTLDWCSDLYRGALSGAPSNPADGWLYYNTSDSSLYVYSGGWVAIGTSTPPSTSYRVLTEAGDNFTLESGDILRTE